MNFRELFTKQEEEDFCKLKSNESKRRFVQLFVSRHFECLVYLLGYRDLGRFHVEQIKRMAQVGKLSDIPTRRLWLWSRGFFKTSLITQAHSIWLIINNPDIRILLVSNTISVAEDILRNIKNHFIGNYEFRYFFKEFCPQPNSAGKIEFGTNQDFTIPNRNQSKTEPTIMVAGIGTNLTGLHFDYQKIDDLVTKDSVTNDTQIQASKDYYASLRHLFDKAAVPREDVVGTIYHFNDLYFLLRKSNLFQESFIPARIDGKAVFPERLTDDKLDELINDPSVGPYQFQTQYMLNPVNPAEAKFKEGWLKYYEKIPEGLAEYICVDPASTTKKKSDYTVIERWGVSNEGEQYLLEGVRDKLTAFERIDKLFEIIDHCKNLKWVKYEVIGGRHGDLEVIDQRQKEKKIYFQIKETKSTSHSKVDRIEQRLVGMYHAGKVLLPEHFYFTSKFDGKVHDFISELKLEFLQFPFTEHDDILDCQSQMMEEELIRGEKLKTVEEKIEGLTADEEEKRYSIIKKYENRYGRMAEDIMFRDKMRALIRAGK